MRKYKIERKKLEFDDRNINLLVATPLKSQRDKNHTPCVLWIHGGGYYKGRKEMFYITRAKALVKKYGAVVVCLDYRLSKKHPYPAALEDCYEVLKYIKTQSEELNFNINKIFVGGESAGGGLAIALSIYARDKKEINIAYHMPLCPMIDYRETVSSRNNTAPFWNTKMNKKAWGLYLKNIEKISKYASPSLETNFQNLPPCYTFVGDIEPFLDETVTYVNNLKKAGIEAEVDVYENWFHSYDLIFPFTKKGKTAIKKFEDKFLYAIEHYSASNL